MSAIGTRENPRGVILVQGTHGWTRPWWKRGSPFVRHLERHGFMLLDGPNGKQFVWTTALNGLRALRRWIGLSYEPKDWIVGSQGFCATVLRTLIKYGASAHEHLNAVTHSHGIWPVILGVGPETPLRCLMTIAPPGRFDMIDALVAARPHIGYWVLVCDADTDVIAAAGGAGDGHVGIDREFSFLRAYKAGPDLVIKIPRIGHSKLLEEAGAHLWDDYGLFDQLHLAGTMPEAYGV